MRRRRDKSGQPWHLYLLGLAAIAVAVLAVIEIGPPSSSARTSREIVTAEPGVVQSTVTGTGNVAAGTDVDANFRTSGTLATVNVSVGQHVNQGQLLATLDPSVAQLTLDQAEQNLTAAQDQLTAIENGTATSGTGGGSAGSGGSSGGGSSGSSGSSASASTGSSEDSALVPASGASSTEFALYKPGSGRPPFTTSTSSSTTTTTTSSSSTRSKPASTKPSKPSGSYPSSGTGSSSGSSSPPSSGRGGGPSSGAGGGSGGAGSAGSGGAGGSSGTAGTGRVTTSTTTSTSTTPSPASIASAQASIYSAQASVQNAETALANTKLYAPASGTIVSLASLSPGDAVSAGSNASASNSGSGSSGSSPGGSSASSAGSSTAGSLGGSSGSSSSGGSSGSSSTPFAEIVNTDSLTMTVAFSESDIGTVKVGQPATVTMDALSGVELAAHVSSISTVGTTSSGVVSYDATLTIDQTDSRVKPGMSASASVITGQAQGITVPNQAVTGSGSLGTVDVLTNGKSVSQQVVVGLRGNSRTEIISGLKAGEQLVVTITLPSLRSSGTSTSGSSGTLGGGRFGGAGGFGGGFGGGGGVFRGAGASGGAGAAGGAP